MPSDPNGYLRLNLKGREAAGTLAREDVAPLVETLREGLMSFEDCEGGAAVAGVHDLFTEVKNGELASEVDALPDVLVEWVRRPATHVSGVTSPRHGTIERAGGPGGPTGRGGRPRGRRVGGGGARRRRPAWPTGPRPAGGRGRHGVRAAGRGCRWAAGQSADPSVALDG